MARLDTSLLRVIIHAGTTQPADNWSNQGSIASARIPTLVAAFNGAFQLNAAGGRFYADGHANPPLVDGAASLVVKSDGTAFVAQWGRDATLTPEIVQVSQNLTLMVDGGVPTPAVSTRCCSATVTRSTVTRRSGVGSDSAHHLFLVGGPGLTPSALASPPEPPARLEYDISAQWVLFASFTDGPTSPPTTVGTKLLASMNYPADHFFHPDWHDSVALFTKPRSFRPARGQAIDKIR